MIPVVLSAPEWEAREEELGRRAQSQHVGRPRKTLPPEVRRTHRILRVLGRVDMTACVLLFCSINKWTWRRGDGIHYAINNARAAELGYGLSSVAQPPSLSTSEH